MASDVGRGQRSDDTEESRVQVLYVDPSADGSELETEHDDIEVIALEDAETALDRLAQQRFDCIVSEYVLPESDGLAFLGAVRSVDADVPFVLFTDAGDERVASEAFAEGANGYLRKTDGYGALADRVVDIVSKHRVAAPEDDLFGLLGREVEAYGLFILGPNGRVVEWGEGARRLIGYRTAEIRDEHIDTFTPADRSKAALTDSLLERAVAVDCARNEGWFVRADGSRFWADVSVRPLRRRGALEGFGVVVSPLSGEFERAYETITADPATVEPFQFVGRTLPDGTVVDANTTALEFAEMELNDVLGERLWEAAWWPDDERDRIREAVENAAEGSVVRFETEIGDHGDTVPVDFSIRPVVDESDDVAALIPEARDITERKERERRLRAIFDQTFGFTGLLDPDGTVIEANESALEFGGVSREEVIGKMVWETYWFQHGDAAERAKDAVERARNGEFVRMELEVQGADRIMTIDFSVKPVTDETGDVVLLIPEGRDITELKEREAELREERAFVERILAALPAMQLTVGTDGDLLRWNDQFVAATGYSETELDSMELLDIMPDEEQEEITEVVRRILEAGEEVTIETRFQTANGERIPVEFAGAPFAPPDGGDHGLVVFARDITEQKERQRRLEAIFDQTFQFTGLLEPDGTVIEANRTALEFGGVSREEVIGKMVWDTYWFQHGDGAERAKDAVERARNGEFVRFELEVQGAERIVTIDFSVKPVTDEMGDVVLLIPEGRDITEFRRRTEQLRELNEIARNLTEADTEDAVCELAVDAARETLRTPFAAVDRYDDSTATLERWSETDGVADLPSGTPFDPADDATWEAFVDGVEHVFEESTEPLESTVILPLGRHGVLITGFDSGRFSDTDMDVARVFAAHVEFALDRIDHERSLRERTEALEERTEQLERLNRINEVIRGLVGALIKASSREEIEADICEELTATGLYQFAWVGFRDPVSAEIRPEAWAGEGGAYLDAVTITTEPEDDEEPAGRAVRERTSQVVDQIGANPPLSPWRKEALEAGLRSAISVPLVYEDALYGVLNVYSDAPDIFDDIERAVIEELGEIAGYAINVTESKQALLADSVVELEFRLPAPDLDLFEFAREAGDRLELEGLVRSEEGSSRVFFTLEGAMPEAARQLAAKYPSIREFEVVSSNPEEEAFVFECVIGGGLVATLLEHGAAPQTITLEGDDVQVIVELPSSRNVREFVELIETKYEGATLVARRMRDRPIQTKAGFRERLESSLTDRQYAAVRTAFLSGYFEWPRESTGEDVAELMDVTQPTFNRHLREAQRKLFELILD